MINIHISIVNASTEVTDEALVPVVAALQKQVSHDFAPAWGIDAKLRFVPKGKSAPEGDWCVMILDAADEAGALGYHDLTHDGLPLGKVFAKTSRLAGDNWTVAASHEVLEMLADPNTNLAVMEEAGHGGRLFAYEVCDPCQDDHDGYLIDGVLVSDFVYPSWFESFREPGSTKFDHQGKIRKPFELLSRGYISVYDIGSKTGWHHIDADGDGSKSAVAPPKGSRRERRTVPPGLRQRGGFSAG